MKKKLLALAVMGLMFFSAGSAHAAELTLPNAAGGEIQKISDTFSGSIVSCIIQEEDRDRIRVEVSFEEGAALPDRLYLFAQPVYAEGLQGAEPAAEVTTVTGQTSYVFETDLLNGTADNRLYCMFQVAAAEGDSYQAVTDYAWISNPGILSEDEIPAQKAMMGQGGNSKKGIQVVNNILPDVEDLGASHTFFNIVLQQVISLHPTNYYYDYNGTRYYFVENIIQDFDRMLGILYDGGAEISVALLSEHRGGYEFLICPGVDYRPETYGYAWNTQDPMGAGYIQATLSYLASRYNGTVPERGKVSNWIIGNEVNDNLQYYYMGPRDRDSYVNEYYKTFRMAYNAILSGNAAANVYIPLQGRWMTYDTWTDYGGRGFLDTFNNLARSQGNFNWGVAYHPYSHPIATDNILKDGQPSIDQNGRPIDGGHVTDQWDSPIITMRNINVLTDYLNQAHLKTNSNEVRSLILAEQGWTSVSNVGATEQTQAANIVLAYYKAEMNPDVDAFILRAHVDAEEGSPYYKFGLWTAEQSNYAKDKKYAYNIFKYMDTKESLKVTEFAKDVLGIKDWASVVPNFNPAKFNSMRTIEMAGVNQITNLGAITNSIRITSEMTGQWVAQHNVHGFGVHGYHNSYYPRGVAVLDPNAYYRSQQGLKYQPPGAMDLTHRPYLFFTVEYQARTQEGMADKLLTRVRIFSKNHINESNAILDVNRPYNLCINLSNWEYRGEIDRIEIWVQEHGQAKSFDGTMTVYDMHCAQHVSAVEPLTTDYSLNPENVYFAFSDVNVIPGNWKYEGVKFVSEKGLMSGYSSSTKFGPDDPLTRAQFAAILHRMANSPAMYYDRKFSDVEPNKWYSIPVIWVNYNQIATGLSDGRFGINDYIQRDQMAKMLYLYAEKIMRCDMSKTTGLGQFTDVASVKDWSVKFLQWANANGIITGKPNGDGSNRLDPQGLTTRAECAAILQRFLEKFGQ